MKIKFNTPDLLIACETPWLAAATLIFFSLSFVGIGLAAVFSGVWVGLIWVVIGGGMGLGAMAIFVEHLQLVMDARTQTLTLRRRTIFSDTHTVISLSDVIRAAAETGNSPRKIISRLSFEIRDKVGSGGTTVIPMTELMPNSQDATTVIRAANEWLHAYRRATWTDCLRELQPTGMQIINPTPATIR